MRTWHERRGARAHSTVSTARLHARFPILLFSASASSLSPEESILFSRCLDKGVPVRHLLDVIGIFLDPNDIPDFGA
jgi:hypothetical protein